MMTKNMLKFWKRLSNFSLRRSHFYHYLIFIFTLITVLNFPSFAKNETLTSTQQVNYFPIGQQATAATQPANVQELISQGRNFYKIGKFADAVEIGRAS